MAYKEDEGGRSGEIPYQVFTGICVKPSDVDVPAVFGEVVLNVVRQRLPLNLIGRVRAIQKLVVQVQKPHVEVDRFFALLRRGGTKHRHRNTHIKLNTKKTLLPSILTHHDTFR